jgi:hypothetical protein
MGGLLYINDADNDSRYSSFALITFLAYDARLDRVPLQGVLQ